MLSEEEVGTDRLFINGKMRKAPDIYMAFHKFIDDAVFDPYLEDEREIF